MNNIKKNVMYKKFYPLIMGMGNAIIIIILVNLFLSFTGTYLNQMFFFVLIPAGPAVLGYYASKGVLFGVEKGNDMPDKKIYFYTIVVALTCFIGIYFVSYLTAFVSSDMTINHKLIGSHISNFVLKDTNEKINFFNFMKMLMKSKNVSMFLFGNGASGGLPINNIQYSSAFNWLRFIIEGLTFVFSSLFGIRVLKGIPHCLECSKILKRKDINIYNIEEDISLEEFHNEFINSNIDDIINKRIKRPIIGNRSFKILNISYCPKCFKGYLQIRSFSPEYFICKENKIKKEEIDIDSEFTKMLVNNDQEYITNEVKISDF